MKKIEILSTVIFLLIAFSNLYSFDGERNGFILGAGIGGGYLSNSTSYESCSKTDSRGVFFTNFKIGYAPNNTLEIYYVSRVSWWGETNMTYALGLSAIAATYYTDTEAETGLSVSGGLGLSTLSAPFESGYGSSNGFGLFGGAGYEFARHWSVELDVLYSTISESDADLNSFGVRLTINVLAY
jgi:opacity protein-like surface antigen